MPCVFAQLDLEYALQPNLKSLTAVVGQAGVDGINPSTGPDCDPLPAPLAEPMAEQGLDGWRGQQLCLVGLPRLQRDHHHAVGSGCLARERPTCPHRMTRREDRDALGSYPTAHERGEHQCQRRARVRVVVDHHQPGPIPCELPQLPLLRTSEALARADGEPRDRVPPQRREVGMRQGCEVRSGGSDSDDAERAAVVGTALREATRQRQDIVMRQVLTPEPLGNPQSAPPQAVRQRGATELVASRPKLAPALLIGQRPSARQRRARKIHTPGPVSSPTPDRTIRDPLAQFV